MTPFYSDDWLTLYGGDCREVLASLPSDSVDCVVTSPPYWGLRDYGTATWVGGDEACDHRVWGHAPDKPTPGGRGGSMPKQEVIQRERCGKCGAIRVDSQLGLERTPEEYVANMVAVFREVRRVLKPSGTCWVNLGSSYMTTPAGNKTPSGFQQKGSGGQSGALAQWKGDGAGASGRSPSRRRGRAPAYGSDGTALAGSTAPGSAYSDLCDGCRAESPSRRRHSAGTHDQPSDALLPEPIDRDTEPQDSSPEALGALPLGAQESTTPRFEPPLPGECSHCGNCGACLSVLRSVGRDARLCVRRSAYNGGTARPEPTSAGRTGDTESSGEAWGDYTSTLKHKDMVPIPWMVAMALQADGWYLRSDIIWSKPNPMPESVTDRPTKSHEYLFLLTKSARYLFDSDAVREAHTVIPFGGKYDGYAPSTKDHHLDSQSAIREGKGRMGNPEGGRNIRSVWNIATRPYPGSHFAVFPPELPERCIKAGSSEKGVCSECGAPWERWVERSGTMDRSKYAHRKDNNDPTARQVTGGTAGTVEVSNGQEWAKWKAEHPDKQLGWRPTCDHRAAPVPAVILDPFGGSGTVGMVANRLSRRAILIDLNPEYLKQQMRRNAQTPLGLTEGDAA